MKASLQFRLSQHLALTPQLQQSIRLLQLSTLELHQEVEQMLEANPFLEPEEEPAFEELQGLERASGAERRAAGEDDGDQGAEAAGAAEFADGAATDAAGDLRELGADDFAAGEPQEAFEASEAWDFNGHAEASFAPRSAASGDDEGLDPQERSSAVPDLRSHLREQLAGLRLPPEDSAAVQLLIDSLDDDGYLHDELSQIAAALVPDIDGDAAEDLLSRLRCALHWLRRLDPPGVGARDLGECLSLQLQLRPPCAAREVALAICAGHLELLARRDIRKLMAATGADEALVRQAQALIVACEPKPGRPFADAQSLIVVPDVVVQRSGRGLRVVLNPEVMPRLRINDLYASAMRGQRGGPMSVRLQEARWFIKNVQQRFDTILRVSQAIVERQRAFFTHGEVAMRPLVLREIADELGLHESTISRVTTSKYMATPMGTFELKYFFGSSLATEAGGNASSTAVRALIRQLVAAEDAKRPLSDSAISQMLEDQGIQVARRTVAKYREALRIAPASQRRAL